MNDCDHCIHYGPTVYELHGCRVAEIAYMMMDRDGICKAFERRGIDEQQTGSESGGTEN